MSFALATGGAVAATPAADFALVQSDGPLVRVGSAHFDEIELRSGVDFSRYTGVMLDAAQVELAGSWLRDMNANRIVLLQRTSEADAERIREKFRGVFERALERAFSTGGYRVVTSSGPDILKVSAALRDVYINAPGSVTLAVPSRVYTTAAGTATLAVEIRDSSTGALLLRLVDQRNAGDRGAFASSFMVTTPVTNYSDFSRTFDLWARGLVRSLGKHKRPLPLANVQSDP